MVSSTQDSNDSDIEDDESQNEVIADQPSIEYSVRIPSDPFSAIEKYSILFEEVCDTFNFSREGCRAIRHLINSILADESLGTFVLALHKILQ
jgi:hypothetical protein